jgi:hypothetical protein
VNSILAVEGAAGALVYWRLEGVLDPAELAVRWKAAGLDTALIPQTPAPTTALTRALREFSSRRRMIRSLDGRAGHAIVNETAANDDLSYVTELKARLDPAGRPVFEPADHKLVPRLRADYDYQLSICSSEDVAAWLVRLIRRLDGLALRDTGGFYYLPPAHVAEWQKIVDCLRAVSEHKVFLIPAMRTTDAVDALLDAIVQDAKTEADGMEMELVEGLNGRPLGERALKSRVGKCEAVEAKVTRYEALLGTKLDVIRTRLEVLRGNLAAAALAAMTEAEAS